MAIGRLSGLCATDEAEQERESVCPAIRLQVDWRSDSPPHPPDAAHAPASPCGCAWLKWLRRNLQHKRQPLPMLVDKLHRIDWRTLPPGPRPKHRQRCWPRGLSHNEVSVGYIGRLNEARV